MDQAVTFFPFYADVSSITTSVEVKLKLKANADVQHLPSKEVTLLRHSYSFFYFLFFSKNIDAIEIIRYRYWDSRKSGTNGFTFTFDSVIQRSRCGMYFILHSLNFFRNSCENILTNFHVTSIQGLIKRESRSPLLWIDPFKVFGIYVPQEEKCHTRVIKIWAHWSGIDVSSTLSTKN